ncbi:hypothetical protein COI_0216 [Mannheimia haemolytica serotype A2 str. OVINE]|nr:hypothetical protein COI_0216 [Mannheimia haemolytica serotype A2 str. OVINE]
MISLVISKFSCKFRRISPACTSPSPDNALAVISKPLFAETFPSVFVIVSDFPPKIARSPQLKISPLRLFKLSLRVNRADEPI